MDTIEQVAVHDAADRQWAAGVHVGALLAAFFTHWFAGVAGALVALGVWALVRERHPFAAAHAKEALNFNITLLIASIVLILVTVLTFFIAVIITVPIGILLGIAWVVLTIMAAMKANEGVAYRYPFTLRLVK